MWRRVDIVLTDLFEERIASIFRVEEKEEIRERTSVRRCNRQHLFTLIRSRSSSFSSTLKMEAISSSETLVNGATFQKIAFFIVTTVKTSDLTHILLVVQNVEFCYGKVSSTYRATGL
jgi:hypothetical protein